jgi:hypothetical protein
MGTFEAVVAEIELEDQRLAYCDRSTANVGASSPSPAWRNSTMAK